ncbi:transglutaminase family protein [Candidatus Zixiibacteriota bacterium]
MVHQVENPRKFRLLLHLLVFSIYTVCHACASPAFGDPAEYEIRYRDQCLGFIHVDCQEAHGVGNDSVDVISEVSILEMTAWGILVRWETTSTWEIEAGPGRLRSYRTYFKDGHVEEVVDVEREQGDSLQARKVIEEKVICHLKGAWSEHLHLIPGQSVVGLTLLYRSLMTPVRKSLKVMAFVPRECSVVELIVSPQTRDTLDVLGVPTECWSGVVEMQGQSLKAWMNAETGELCRLSAPMHDLEITRIESGTNGESAPPDVVTPVCANANGMSSPLERVNSLDITITATVYGERPSVKLLNSERQQFTGSIAEQQICGDFKVRSQAYTGEQAPDFPLSTATTGGFERHLCPEIGVESRDPKIIRLADSITVGSSNAWEAVVRIASWVCHSLAGGALIQASAKEALVRRQGDAGEKSKLCIALCRAAGIPARLVTGIVAVATVGGYRFCPHAWLEVHFGGEVWIPVDPTVDQLSFVDATHVKLGQWGTISSLTVTVNSVKLDGE